MILINENVYQRLKHLLEVIAADSPAAQQEIKAVLRELKNAGVGRIMWAAPEQHGNLPENAVAVRNGDDEVCVGDKFGQQTIVKIEAYGQEMQLLPPGQTAVVTFDKKPLLALVDIDYDYKLFKDLMLKIVAAKASPCSVCTECGRATCYYEGSFHHTYSRHIKACDKCQSTNKVLLGSFDDTDI
jgi:hypothetical protein